MSNQIFNFKRLSMLMRNDLVLQSRTLWIVALTFIVISAVLPFHVSASIGFYFTMLYVGGFIFTANAFNDLHDPRKSFGYLTLPASNFEKFLSKWLLTAIAYAVVLLVAYYLFSWLSVLVNQVVYNQAVYPLDLTQLNLWLDIGRYMILQSVVLLGAVFFKKNALIKTALSVACLFLAINILAFLFSFSFSYQPVNTWSVSFNSTIQNGTSFIWLILAPVCLVLTYLRLAKYELK